MNEGIIIGRIFMFICAGLALFSILKPEIGARWTYESRKNDWNLTEGSIPVLKFFARLSGIIMFPIFVYVFIMMPKFIH